MLFMVTSQVDTFWDCAKEEVPKLFVPNKILYFSRLQCRKSDYRFELFRKVEHFVCKIYTWIHVSTWHANVMSNRQKIEWFVENRRDYECPVVLSTSLWTSVCVFYPTRISVIWLIILADPTWRINNFVLLHCSGLTRLGK